MQILHFLADPIAALRIVVGALMVKVCLAILVAIYEGRFNWHRLAEYLHDDALTVGGGLVVVWLATLVDPALTPVFTACADAATVTFGREAVDHIASFFATFAKAAVTAPAQPGADTSGTKQ